MAFIATLQILIDDPNESTVYDGLNELLRDAKAGGANGENQDWILDWKFASVDLASDSLNDSICNETYAEGDAFRDWVIFSPSEAATQDGAGFWSNEYGWTTLDLATKFGATTWELPSARQSWRWGRSSRSSISGPRGGLAASSSRCRCTKCACRATQIARKFTCICCMPVC